MERDEYLFPIDKSQIPLEFLEKFKIKEVDFKVDEFEELILQDIMQFDENTRIKLNRDVTKLLLDWVENKIIKKENVSINGKGSTRSGKSLVMLKQVERICRKYGKPFDTEKIICANQKEYRLKLQTASFGDCYQIDENAFANVGEGSMTEMQQLKDVQNIIAKKNIHTFYITPRSFLPTGATLGLSAWGKDADNWISRFLLYSLKGMNPILMGYVVINVGELFTDYGCFFNRIFGGCTNPRKLVLEKVDEKCLTFKNLNTSKYEEYEIDFLKYSSCIPQEKKENLKENLELTQKDVEDVPCPFYRICKHPLCRYELKKDSWIAREMSGGMDERQAERFTIAISLMRRIGVYDNEKERFLLKARNSKDLNVKVSLYLPKVTNTKLTKTEKEEVVSIIQSISSPEVFMEVIKNLKLDIKEVLADIEGSEIFLEGLELQSEKENEKK